MVDTLVSGTSGRKAVQVRVLFRAQKSDLFFARGIRWMLAVNDQGSIFPGVVGTMVTKEAGLSEAGLEVEGAAEAGGDADETANVADRTYADA